MRNLTGVSFWFSIWCFGQVSKFQKETVTLAILLRFSVLSPIWVLKGPNCSAFKTNSCY